MNREDIALMDVVRHRDYSQPLGVVGTFQDWVETVPAILVDGKYCTPSADAINFKQVSTYLAEDLTGDWDEIPLK